jgi:hypothetical protein
MQLERLTPLLGYYVTNQAMLVGEHSTSHDQPFYQSKKVDCVNMWSSASLHLIL